MTITCLHCGTENRVAGYYHSDSTAQGKAKPQQIQCVQCGKALPKPEASDVVQG